MQTVNCVCASLALYNNVDKWDTCDDQLCISEAILTNDVNVCALTEHGGVHHFACLSKSYCTVIAHLHFLRKLAASGPMQ